MSYEVTIGIPVYNCEKYVAHALDSALAQTFDKIEYLICDDCGTDGSMDIVEQYRQTHPRGQHIRVIHQPHNTGIGAVRNRIIDECHSRYLYFFDADDELTPNAIELLYRAAEETQAQLAVASWKNIYVEQHDMTQPHVYPDMRFTVENEFAEYVYDNYSRLQAQVWNMLIEVDVLRSNGLRFQHVNYWEDFAFTIGLPTYVTRAVLLPDVTYLYYCRNGSLSAFQQRKHIDKEEIVNTIGAMNAVKRDAARLIEKPYFHKWMQKVMKTHLYICLSILRNKKIIAPPFTNTEIRDIMRSPLTLRQTLALKGHRVKNAGFYLMGILPPALSVFLMQEGIRLKRDKDKIKKYGKLVR